MATLNALRLMKVLVKEKDREYVEGYMSGREDGRLFRLPISALEGFFGNEYVEGYADACMEVDNKCMSIRAYAVGIHSQRLIDLSEGWA